MCMSDLCKPNAHMFTITYFITIQNHGQAKKPWVRALNNNNNNNYIFHVQFSESVSNKSITQLTSRFLWVWEPEFSWNLNHPTLLMSFGGSLFTRRPRLIEKERVQCHRQSAWKSNSGRNAPTSLAKVWQGRQLEATSFLNEPWCSSWEADVENRPYLE